MTKLAEKIHKLYETGHSYTQIQKILECSKGTISYHLGAGQKDKTRMRVSTRRNAVRRYVHKYKQERGCADCKEMYPYWMLDLDHLSDKSFTISQYHQHTSDLEVVKKELEKCEVVCANCHRNRTHSRQIQSGEGVFDLTDEYLT